MSSLPACSSACLLEERSASSGIVVLVVFIFMGYSIMCTGRLHFSRTLAGRAAASWRVWTRRQVAAAELYDAAMALHRSWIASAGLRALDRVARCDICYLAKLVPSPVGSQGKKSVGLMMGKP